MKKLIYLMVLVLILGLALTGCFLSNVGQVPTSEQSGITYLTKALPSGLVGLWHFDEGIGSKTQDSSVNNNEGNLYEAKWEADGKFSNALSFDGLYDYVDCGNDTSLQITGAITIEAWIKTTQITRGEIVSKYDAHWGERSYVFDIGYSGAGKLALSISSTKNPYTGFSMPSNITVNDGKWHHVVAVFDPAGVYAKIFVDGIDRSGTMSGLLQSSIAVSARNLAIGAGYAASATPNAYFFDGLIDEVRIWNKALDEGEIAYNYNLGGVTIDIKPGSDPNSINLKSKGVIPVAILGSVTFDVTTVDVTTLKFGPNLASTAHDLTDSIVYADHLQDVNVDGFTDLVCHFKTQKLGLVEGSTEATLIGETNGLPFTGTDLVRIVGK